jgi:hypothetical protein
MWDGVCETAQSRSAEARMQPLMFRCPRTGREIVSGIHAEPEAMVRLFTLRLRCPACEDLHEWHVSEGRVDIRRRTIPYTNECRFVPERETSAKILADLGMSDREIAAYFCRFSTAVAPLRPSGEEMQYNLNLKLFGELEHAERA